MKPHFTSSAYPDAIKSLAEEKRKVLHNGAVEFSLLL
jgi:hypothetical protein